MSDEEKFNLWKAAGTAVVTGVLGSLPLLAYSCINDGKPKPNSHVRGSPVVRVERSERTEPVARDVEPVIVERKNYSNVVRAKRVPVERSLARVVEHTPEPKKGINRERLAEVLENHEGRRNWVYDDATSQRLRPGDLCSGNRTVGVGLNLESGFARKIVAGMGINYNDVLYGRVAFSDSQIDLALDKSIDLAISDARKYVGKDFDKMPAEAKEVIVNMALNLGYTRLSGFKDLRKALRNGDYSSAADEMVDSKWYGQTGRRARDLVEEMRSVSRD